MPDELDIRKRRRELRGLWRLCGWGGATAIALAAVAIISQTQIGGERLKVALAPVIEPVRPLASAEAPPQLVERVVERAVENEAATRHLAAEVRALTADRDRLAVRLASLERHLDDMTGAINKPPTAAPAAKASVQPPAIEAASTPATTSDAPSPSQTAATQAAAPKVDVPLPPIRVATIPIVKPEPAPEPPPAKSEYGIDLGTAPTVELLRLRWAAVKANYGPLLTGLHPVAAPEHRQGHSAYRLVAGPLPTALAATQLCSRFAAMRAPCRPTKFSGENLAQR